MRICEAWTIGDGVGVGVIAVGGGTVAVAFGRSVG
jgi:sRNA-binding carbon storage regulator CsrA